MSNVELYQPYIVIPIIIVNLDIIIINSILIMFNRVLIMFNLDITTVNLDIAQVILGTLSSFLLDLKTEANFDVVGDIPMGLVGKEWH